MLTAVVGYICMTPILFSCSFDILFCMQALKLKKEATLKSLKEKNGKKAFLLWKKLHKKNLYKSNLGGGKAVQIPEIKMVHHDTDWRGKPEDFVILPSAEI